MIVYARAGADTARALAQLVGCPAVRMEDMRNPPPRVVAWGCKLSLDAEVLNNRDVLDKIEHLNILREAGVLVPRVGEYERVIWRKRRHFGGRDAIIGGSSPGDDFIPIEFIPSVKEYRIHVWDGAVIHTQRKMWHGDREPTLIRNHRNGWLLIEFQPRNLDHAMYTAPVAAVRALGLTFGAVDVLLGEDGRYYVLEVNTAPGLEEPTLSKYANRIRSWLSA